VVIG
jgi:hypothetical protein